MRTKNDEIKSGEDESCAGFTPQLRHEYPSQRDHARLFQER